MTYISKDELLSKLEGIYGDLENNEGCSCNVYGNREWLSVAKIVDIIERCMVTMI